MNYWVCQVKNFKLEGWKIWDVVRQICPYLRKYKYLVKEEKGKMLFLHGCLNGGVQFLIFKTVHMIFRCGQSLGTNLGFQESFSDR